MKRSRREMLQMTGGALLGLSVAPHISFCAQQGTASRAGAIVGETAGAEAGTRVLSEGGNAIDALVAAALVSCVATPSRCGVGGYGGHMTIALQGGKKVTSIDFNSMAPNAARPDMYPLDDQGKVVNDANFHGWLAAGVPGTMAGLQMALDRYGTKSFREVAQQAIELARKGVVISTPFASTLRSVAPRFRKEPGSAKIYLRDGQPLQAGEILKNPELAELLATLAERNSVESFYRGDIAQRLADDFKKNGGLVTTEDLAAYHAREVQPLKTDWESHSIYTAPLTAGGLTMLEAFSILTALNWKPRSVSVASIHAWLEAMRLSWKDRLESLGDPDHVKVPVEKLLSKEYARQQAEKIKMAVRNEKPVAIQIDQHVDEGTVNLSCADARGNMAAITLTQGGGFGAQVTAEGLGIILGHGMSRFNPHPHHPNSPGPRKRPLHNMCPSVVLRGGKPLLAIGAAGGLRIPTSLYCVLTEFVGRKKTIDQGVAAPRMHTTGTLQIEVERPYPKEIVEHLQRIGFEATNGPTALVSAVYRDPGAEVTLGVLR